MCLIIIGEAKTILERVSMRDAWATNRDGAGVVFPNAKGPRVFKGLMKLKSLMGVLEQGTGLCAVHLRQATHGKVCEQNTHPFRVDSESYLMHNGIISGLGESGSNGRSDSAHLAEILQRVKAKDRIGLLKAVGGRYALIRGNIIHAIGGFDEKEIPGVKLSNTYWNTRYYTPPVKKALPAPVAATEDHLGYVPPASSRHGAPYLGHEDETYEDWWNRSNKSLQESRAMLGIPTTRWPMDGED
jgi:hypothetical protein